MTLSLFLDKDVGFCGLSMGRAEFLEFREEAIPLERRTNIFGVDN